MGVDPASVAGVRRLARPDLPRSLAHPPARRPAPHRDRHDALGRCRSRCGSLDDPGRGHESGREHRLPLPPEAGAFREELSPARSARSSRRARTAPSRRSTGDGPSRQRDSHGSSHPTQSARRATSLAPGAGAGVRGEWHAADTGRRVSGSRGRWGSGRGRFPALVPARRSATHALSCCMIRGSA